MPTLMHWVCSQENNVKFALSDKTTYDFFFIVHVQTFEMLQAQKILKTNQIGFGFLQLVPIKTLQSLHAKFRVINESLKQIWTALG